MKREIVIDTETTGLDPRGGDRIVEVGCIELVNHIPSGRSFHRYVNPERPVGVEAVRIHGLDDAFLKDKPRFAEILPELLAFIGDADLIAHNAEFDFAFLNMEFARCSQQELATARMIDSLMLARRRHPAGPNSLDALCVRYQVDTSRRTFHGALLDAELLAEVYIELIGGRQATLILGEELSGPSLALPGNVVVGPRPEPRLFRVTGAEMTAHRARIEAAIGENALWLGYLAAAAAPEPEARAS